MSRYLFPDFDEYIRQGEPEQKEKASIWRAAIGLQAVDGLTTSDYLRETALKHIEGQINIDQARALIKSYYESKEHHEPDESEKQEADKVSSNITKILFSYSLDFSTEGFISLHRRIFDGVFNHAGILRDYDITKSEWVLDNDTVHYMNWEDLRRALDYDIAQEKAFSYKDLSMDDIVAHISKFISGIWQIHPFGEGNTRTTAVFAILFLRSIGFKVNNDLFADHSWYFRNALVRANYRSARGGVDYSPVYLERFFRNLLLGEQWDLRNRYLHIHPSPEWKIQPNLSDPGSVGQAEDDHPTSTPQVPHKLLPDNPNIVRLLIAIDGNILSIAALMTAMRLNDRKNFLKLYLSPAMEDGCVKMLYPDSPHHPRQKYLLTVKGLALLNELRSK